MGTQWGYIPSVKRKVGDNGIGEREINRGGE